MRRAWIGYRGMAHEAAVVADAFQVQSGGRTVELGRDEVRLLPPPPPSKILAVGWNFPKHLEEMVDRLPERAVTEAPKEPIIFFKPPSCLITDGESIVFPKDATRVEYEGELVVMIGARARRISPEDARGIVRGWTCGNDVTEREMQNADKQWWRAKGYDTFGPVGGIYETDMPDAEALIETRVNGELRQQGRVKDMLFDPFEVLSYISQALTLEPGDLVMLGTPPGVGALAVGDVVEVAVEGVGTLRNEVVEETD